LSGFCSGTEAKGTHARDKVLQAQQNDYNRKPRLIGELICELEKRFPLEKHGYTQ
jgi:hypothetical protein